MTRPTFLGGLLLPLLLGGCGGRLLTIPIEDSAEITLEAGTPLDVLVDDLGFGAFNNMDLSSSAELENQGVSPGDITEARFTLLRLTVTSPSDGDLSFLDTLSFFVDADSLEPALVASQDTFPAGQASVDLDLEDLDFKDYLLAPAMDLNTEVTGNQPTRRTTLLAEFRIEVGATAQGLANGTRR